MLSLARPRVGRQCPRPETCAPLTLNPPPHPEGFAGMLRRGSANDDHVRKAVEGQIRGGELGPVASSRRIDHGIRHGEAELERDVGGVQRERCVDGSDRRPPERRDGREGPLLRDVAADDLVDLVNLDRRDEQGLPALEVGGKATRQWPVGEILDPTARINQDQSRSFFSRRPLGDAPSATPRKARIERSGTRKMTPPFSRTVNLIPGRRPRRSRERRGRTSWNLVDSVTVSIVLPKYYRSYFCKSMSIFGYSEWGGNSTREGL